MDGSEDEERIPSHKKCKRKNSMYTANREKMKNEVENDVNTKTSTSTGILKLSETVYTQHVASAEDNEFDKGQPSTSEMDQTNRGCWKKGRRIVSLDWLAKSLKKCNDCCEQLQLHNCINETRQGLRSELTVKCLNKNCLATNLISTDIFSDDQESATMMTDALEKSGIQRDQFNKLLECLEIPHLLPGNSDRLNTQKTASMPSTQDQGVQTEDVNFEDDVFEGEFEPLQQPPILKQLKNILEQYPDGAQIIRELVQNAEDAEASQVKLFYHADTTLSTETGKYRDIFRGPALCFYNDAIFKPEDWKGIKSVYTSVKETDSLKIGRFGLGFKSVFHITDTPVILSGDRLLIINPLEKSAERVCHTIKFDWLFKEMKFRGAQEALNKILDLNGDGIFGLNLKDTRHYPGTIFWFPLRTQRSKLSETVYEEGDMENLFSSFKQEAALTLLFLKSVNSIEMYDKPSEGTLDETFTVNVSNVENQENIENKRKYIMKCLKSSTNGQLPQKSIVSYYRARLVTRDKKEGTKKEINWAVLNYLQGTTDISCKRLMDLAEDKELGYYPYVSVAYPLSPLVTDKETGHVFCFLPLPLENNEKTLTGLPVHVNGFFALTSNRRHMKWPSKDQTEEKDKNLVWNKLMVTEVLPKAYLHLIQEIHNYKQGNSDLTYKCIPDYEKVDDKWKLLLKPLYKLIFSEQLFYSSVDGGNWIKYKDAIFFICRPREENAQVERDLAWTINEYKENLVKIPPHIQRIILHREEDLGQGPASLVTPKFIKHLLNKDGLYKEFTSEQKMNLLRYIVKDECFTDFINVQLIPVDLANVFKNLKQENDEDFVYLCDKEESEILPGIMDKILTKSRLPDHVKDVLLKCAADEDSTKLRELSKEDFPNLLKASLENMRPGEKFKMDYGLINRIWTYINNHFESLEMFETLLVIPDKVNGECIPLSGNYILADLSDLHLLKAVCQILSELSVIVLRDLNKNICTEKVLGQYIQTPTFQGVVCVLEKMIGSKSELQQTELILKVNRTDRQHRIKFAEYLGQKNIASVDVKTFLKKLELFPLTDGRGTSEEIEMTSIESCQTVAPERNFFIKFPKPMIDPSFKKALDLAKQLGCTEVNGNDLILQILEEINGGNVYSISTVQEFMKHFLEVDVFSASEEILQIAKKVHFIPREDDSLGMASELFLRTKDLEDLFANEPNKFIKHNTCWAKQETSCLIKVGLKTEDDLTEDDLLQTCKSLHDMDEKRMDRQPIEKKMRVFIKFISKRELSNQLKEQMRNINWLPIRKEKSAGFPCHLPWRGQDPKYFSLTKPMEGTHNEFSDLAGSTKHILDMNDSEFNMLKGFELYQEPDQDTVLKQLQTIVFHTKGRLNMSKVLSATEKIYDYFFDIYKDNMLDDRVFKELQKMRCVWTEEEFTFPDMIYFKTRNEVSLNPYMFKLPSFFESKWDFFQKLGCNTELEIKDFFFVQDLISKKQIKPDSQPTQESLRDLDILVGILSVLSEMDLSKEILDDVLVPVKSEYDTDIVLKKVHECTYSSGESIFENMVSIEDEDDVSTRINYVHSRVGNDLAEKLGVPSLTSRVLSDSDTSDLLCEWGQHEPLTIRLKNLLQQYEDGFAVPKELIQNADDSGASVVKFLIDDRMNDKFKKSLIDDKMSECQGPALWMYNDGMFEEKDFENILKLGGRTKETDTSKIGKFGLGFSSVYNITDVPSFISGNSIVFLDPRTIHLGKVLKDKSRPGIRMKISKKNAWMLKKIPDQFMPYNGVFGCDLSASGSNPGINGTLFRFPLRTAKQAEGSSPDDTSSVGGNSTDDFTDDRINTKPYRQDDLVALFEDFTKGAGNLLIYSQNIKRIEWYHLPKHGSPGNEKCIYRVSKESSVVKSTVSQSDLHHTSILQHITNLVHTSPLPTETFKITNELLIKVDVPDAITTLIKHATPKAMSVEEKYYVSWASGNKDSLSKSQELSLKGALPLGGVAVPESFTLTYNTDKRNVPYGFYGRSHLFCFLPLPRETPLPVHVNGCFSVEENRKDIFHPGDSKRSDDNVWNKCLLEDVICMSYLELLESVPTELHRTENEKSYSYLWPRCKNDETFGNFTICFYRMVVESRHRIFRRETKKAEFSTCWFLESKLLHDKYVGNAAFKCLENFQDDESMVVMDIEKEIHDLFLDAGCKEHLENQIFSIERFFKEIFFNNIESPFWTKHLTPESRNGLVLFALNSGDQGILEHLQSCECIPTLPKGKLVKPSELVKPGKYAAISKLFDEGDERFPDYSNDGAFREEKHLKVLQDLGMMHDEIPVSLIKDRALSVTKLNDNDSIERCKALMFYLSNNIEEMELDIHNALKNIKFLPVMQKPNDWPLHWMGGNAMCTAGEEAVDSRKYEEPCMLFKPSEKNLVGGVLPLLDDRVLHGIQNENDVLDCLGLQSVCNTRVVLDNLQCVSEMQLVDLTNQEISNLKNVCECIYSYLNEYYSEHPVKEDERIEMERKKIILLHDDVVEPKKCFFEIGTDCRPDLYEIHFDGEIYRYKHFLNAVGVRNTCPSEMILDILRSKSKELQEKTLCRTEGQSEKLTTRLNGILRDYPSDVSILNELLQNADDAGATKIHFIHDMRNHPKEGLFDKSMNEIQGPALCVYNDSCFSENDLQGISKLGEGSKGGDPTKTGKFGIGFNAVYHLTDVPSFLSVGPKTPNNGVLVMFDPNRRYVPLAKGNAPGMRVPYTANIQKKYPYIHNTYLQDIYPAETGTWFRFPLRNKSMRETSEISGEIFDGSKMKELFECLKMSMFESLLFLTNVKEITLFEIPAKSDILTHIYTVSSKLQEHDIKLNQFISKANDNAKRLRKGEYLLNDFMQQSVVYTMSLTDRADNVQREETWAIAQTFGCIRHDRIPVELVESLKDGNIGLSPRGGTAVRINPHIDSTESFNASCFLPLPIRTGLPVHVNGHFSLNSTRQNIWEDDEKKERKSLKGIWNTFMLEEIIPSSYIVLIQELIKILNANEIPSYLERFHGAFPDMSKNTGGIWKKLVNGFYNCAISQPVEIFPIVSITNTVSDIKWVSLLRGGDDFPVYFNNIKVDETTAQQMTFDATQDDLETLQNDSTELTNTLKDLGMKLLDSPIWIFESLSKAGDYLAKKEAHSVLPSIVSAQHIISFVRSWNRQSPDKCRINSTNVKVSDSCLSDVSRLRKLIKFCFNDGKNLEMLDGLPLLVTNDDVLKVFTKSRQIIVSEYCDLLPKTADCFLHRKLVPLFKDCVNECPELFTTLTIDIFAQHIENNIEKRYKTGTGIPWNPNQNEYPNDEWMKTFWQFLATQRHSVSLCKWWLPEWCLVPGEKNRETTLFPFSKSYAVFDIDSFYSIYVTENLPTHFMKLLLPKPWESCGKRSKELFASDRDPDLILRCLSFHSQSISRLTSIDRLTGDKILTFISNNIDIIKQRIDDTLELRRLLRSLPLYVSFDGCLQDMDGPFKMISLDTDQGIPHNALLDITNKCGLRLFQKKNHYKKLFKLLGVTEKNALQFYCDYILPNASVIVSYEDLMAHLDFIRRYILIYGFEYCQQLQPLLKNLHFIPFGNSDKAKASSFFSPHMEIHRHMCRKAELPPAPFDFSEWKHFMEIAGMNTVLTFERFKKYATDIEKMGKEKVARSNVEVKSELLMMELMKITNWGSNSFLRIIKDIHFIVPHIVGSDLKEIDRQYNADSLISFQNSTYNEHADLVWTKSTILPEYANIRKLMLAHDLKNKTARYGEDEIQEVEKSLCIHREPLLMGVISHVNTICDKLEKKFFNAFQKDKSILPDTELIKRTMELFYDFFDKKMHVPSSLKAALDETPIIYCIERQLFFKARQVALKIKDREEILPYLCCGSDKYGKFFELFRHLGASDDATITHYASILQRLKNKVQFEKMTPDELDVVKRSLTAMAGITETGEEDIPSIAPLYLPTEDNQLLESTEILFCDNESYRRRLSVELHVSFMKTVPDQGEIQTFLRKLPDSIRPQLLSSVVQEDITVKRICPNSQHVNTLQGIISAPLFLKVLSNMMSPKLSEVDILSAVSSIHIQSVTELESVLKYRGTTINSSRKTRWCVWEKKGSIYELYIHIQCKPWDCNHLLVRLISVCTENHLKYTQIDQLRTILHADSPASLPGIIQSLGIDIDQSENTWTPPLGSHVPLCFHHLLDNNFTEFTIGEIVAYDVYDPAIDDEESEQSSQRQEYSDSEYIYVKIVRKLVEESDQVSNIQRFVIYDGHTEMTVFSLRLFKLHRREEEESMALAVYTDCHEGSNNANKDKIFEEIRKKLEKAWELGDMKNFRRLVKRLLLKWHPDKNIGRSKFCTEVTQFIFDVIRRLETGRSTSTLYERSPQQRRRRTQDWWYGDQTNEGRWWKTFFDDVENCHKRRREQCSSSSDFSYYRRDRYVSNPQPTVARKWLRQAKMDIISATGELETQSMNEEKNDLEMYNWICFKCHQAAEKALKALIFNKDANRLSRHTHDLRCLITVNDENLREWTNELCDLLPYNSMRYPDCFSGDKIPADVFTKRQSKRAKELACLILEFAVRILE